MIKTIKNRLNVPMAVMLGLVMSSCSLDIEETDSLITEGASDVFNGVENPEVSVNNLYNSLTTQMETQEELYAISEVTTDEQLVPTRGTDWGDNGVWRTLHTHEWGPTHRDIVNVWNNKNAAVLRATEIIDPLSNSSAEQIAQAKFMRAYNMWIVMDAFGQVPFRNPTDGPDVTPTVMTRTEAYNMIVEDLEAAIEGLPASNPVASNKGRAVKASARFLLARVKLNSKVYNGSYGSSDLQDVIDLVDAIEADGYAVTTDYFKTFVGPNYSNTDVIWALLSNRGSKIWNSLHYSQGGQDNNGGGWNGFTSLVEFYDKFEGPAASNDVGLGQEERRGYTQTEASTDRINRGFGYGFQFGDMWGWRFLDKDGKEVATLPYGLSAEKKAARDAYQDSIGYVVKLKDRTGGDLIFTQELPGLVGNNEETGMRLLKYAPNRTGNYSGFVLFRFADAKLMRAEAKFRSGNTGEALTEINEIRQMRENTPDLASLTEMDILDERGRELYLEMIRRTDMIRFGVFKNARGFKAEGDGHTDLFPIPAAALLSNPNLVPNPGY